MMELGIIKEVTEINTVIGSLKKILSLTYHFEEEQGDFKPSALDRKIL